MSEASANNGPKPATEVGLVLGAGGPAATAWHAGVTYGLMLETGFDARSAALIVGTSAGAVDGLRLRVGMSPGDLYARQTGADLTRQGQEIVDRVVTPYTEGASDRQARVWGSEWLPQSPELAARALWPPWRMRPLHAAFGLLPAGKRTVEALEQRLREMHPDRWPTSPLWVTAVRLDDGRRVVFGRDDLEVTAARATRASCAVPARYEPVTVGGREYVDGGLHSATNADLAGPPAFDAVVVSSAMSGDPGWSKVRGGLSAAWSQAFDAMSGVCLSGACRGSSESDSEKSHSRQPWWRESWARAWDEGRALKAARRHHMSAKLREELDVLRRSGTPVLVVEPDPDASEMLDSGAADAVNGADRPDLRASIAMSALEITRRQLRTGQGALMAALLRRAAAAPAATAPS